MPAPIAETIISRPFDHASGPWIENIRVNEVGRIERDGKHYIVKTRQRRSRLVLGLANFFFRLARTPTHALSEVAEWQAWETESFALLHGPERQAFAESQSVFGEVLPGKSMATHLEEGTFEVEMLEPAARELRRAHGLRSPTRAELWSHGDANLANFLYDPVEERARLIDFELQHSRHLSAKERHAEDLLVVLQDLAGHTSLSQWLPSARRFLRAYDCPGVHQALRAKLQVPGGFAGIWWRIRCNHLPMSEVRQRFALLAEEITPAVA